jgi:hypothetical protein
MKHVAAPAACQTVTHNEATMLGNTKMMMLLMQIFKTVQAMASTHTVGFASLARSMTRMVMEDWLLVTVQGVLNRYLVLLHGGCLCVAGSSLGGQHIL